MEFLERDDMHAVLIYVFRNDLPDPLPPGQSDRPIAEFVSDEVVDRFCVVGPVEAHREKLHQLASAGVTQFNIYLMCGEEEQTLETYEREIVPQLRGAKTAT